MSNFISYEDSDSARYRAAERFVGWLEQRAVIEARGDEVSSLEVNPAGRFWLGRLGPKDVVTRQDERGDRLEPCALGVRFRPAAPGPWTFTAIVRCRFWYREKARADSDQRWAWKKSDLIEREFVLVVPDEVGERIYEAQAIAKALTDCGAGGLTAELRVRLIGKNANRSIEVTFVNTSPEIDALADGRLFECSLQLEGVDHAPFELEALGDSFRFDRKVEAFGVNCGATTENGKLCTTDSPACSRARPKYWALESDEPNLSFSALAENPTASAQDLLSDFGTWARSAWSEETLQHRAESEGWSTEMRAESKRAKAEFDLELSRVKRGLSLLKENDQLRDAFSLMNRAMQISARGKYDSWRPFQFAFLLANLQSLVERDSESSVVDVVWFATGGGKTETYLGLLITAALLDRMRGKISGITAWSRFPLRLLSLQQTQRFANAVAAAELVRRERRLGGAPFSLGFLVGGGATPNRIKKDAAAESEWDVDEIEELTNPFRILEVCPFCRGRKVTTRFTRASWRLVHECSQPGCASGGEPLPVYIVDDEIYRFLPTIVVGTLDKAANIGRQTGMRALVGAPWGICSEPGHGYTYATRRDKPNGCLVPDCTSGAARGLPMADALFAPSFRLQDELHLLRDSLGAVDAHYEAALDGLQQAIAGTKPKILASSATLTGYEKQIDVLYNRRARVFPQPPPKEGEGFWTSDSDDLMRQYVALAPRRLTVEFAIDRLIVTLQNSVRRLESEKDTVCAQLKIDPLFVPFLMSVYGTTVVYGNTLQDIDAVVRSSETQYAEVKPPPKVETLTGRTDFDNVRKILDRLEAPEPVFEDRLHIIAASSMMSHGVDIDRLNVMVMLAFPLGVAEFIQATARVGRRWPALVVVVPKMTRERDASLYRAFPAFVSHGDRFVEPIPITRRSRRVLERTASGLELARLLLLHEPNARMSLATLRQFNAYLRDQPGLLNSDRDSISRDLAITDDDPFLKDQLSTWFDLFARNLREPPADANLVSAVTPTGQPMLSLRDVEEQAPVAGDETR